MGMNIETAGKIADFHAELVRKGLSEQVATEIASRMALSNGSDSDGHCGGDLVRVKKDI
jgi:hypothetical protein